MACAAPVTKTIVTRERVVAPPDRFIDITDGELVSYFQGEPSDARRGREARPCWRPPPAARRPPPAARRPPPVGRRRS